LYQLNRIGVLLGQLNHNGLRVYKATVVFSRYFIKEAIQKDTFMRYFNRGVDWWFWLMWCNGCRINEKLKDMLKKDILNC